MGSSLILLAASWLARTCARGVGAKGGVVEVGPAPQDGELVPPLLHACRRDAAHVYPEIAGSAGAPAFSSA